LSERPGQGLGSLEGKIVNNISDNQKKDDPGRSSGGCWTGLGPTLRATSLGRLEGISSVWKGEGILSPEEQVKLKG